MKKDTFVANLDNIEAIEPLVRTRVLYTCTEHWQDFGDETPEMERWLEIEIVKVEVSTALHPDKGLDITDQLLDSDIKDIVSLIREKHDSILDSLQKVVA